MIETGLKVHMDIRFSINEKALENAKGNHWFVKFNKLRLMLACKSHKILFLKGICKDK